MVTLPEHTKDSHWSIDVSRCKSILLKSHWVLVVMDQFTRGIIDFDIHAGGVDGTALCRILNTAISSQGAPHHLSADNDPNFRYHRGQANLRVPGIDEIMSIPYTPVPRPFVARLNTEFQCKYRICKEIKNAVWNYLHKLKQ